MLQANSRCASYTQIVEEYNSTHTDVVTKQAVQTYFKINKIKRPYNHGKFTEGMRPRCLPIGTIRKSHFATYIKVADTLKHSTGYKKPDWVPLQEKIWLDAGREVPDGMMLIFLDGDRENFSLENIYPISRKTSAIMAANQWYSNDPERTLTAIKWCELFGAIKDTEENGAD